MDDPDVLRSQLRQTELTLQAFLDFAPAIISARDTEGRLLLSNARFGESFRRPVDGLSGPSVVTPEMLAWAESLERQVIETGEVVQGENVIPAPDDTVTVYEFTKFPIRDAAGAVCAVGTIGVDVTADRRAVDALRESEERFRQMANSLDEVFLLWEEGSLEMLYVSPSAERITGLTPEQLNDPTARLGNVHPDDRHILRSAPAPVKEFRIIKPDGQIRWLRSRTMHVTTAEGVPDRGASTITDVTDQKVAELAALSARVEAERANRAKSEFLSRMSHELRTPLNAILGFGQLLQTDDGLDPEHVEQVEQITKAGRHLRDLINEVLDVSRIESGQISISLEPVRLGDALGDALEMVRPMAEQQRIHILTDTQVGERHVHADRQRLTQVILNLLTNAVKYNRPDGEVRLRCDSPADGLVRLVVADTGIGIAAADRDRLFTPFARLGAENTDVEGTGLGLAHSKHLVEAMGGRIGADSDHGVGSRFWIDLPSADPTALASSRRPAGADDAVARRRSTVRTVLFIEDNAPNVRLMRGIVARRPEIRLEVAMRGSEGLELAVERPPALILLDLHLPDQSGEDVLRTLRADPRTADIPVVIVSADATEPQIERLLAAGAAEYITKPFEIDRVLAVIDATDPSASTPG